MKIVLSAITLIMLLFSNYGLTQNTVDSLNFDTTIYTPPLNSLPFPSSEWPNGPIIGVSTEAADYALQKTLGMAKNKSRIKIYGWIDPSCTFGTSKKTNIPVAYNIIPNSFQLDQLVLRIERQPNTIQKNKFDWGFRVSNVYGMDYRYTIAKGWFSDQLLQKNNLYGYDVPELYGLLYFPKVAQGMLLKVGRFISPADIEAQLAPDNYLFSHSVSIAYDPFTFTGVQNTIKLSKQWHIQMGIHGGNDMAIWTNSSSVNGLLYARWSSKSGNDAIWWGINSLGTKGTYKNGHDNSQMVAGIWSHKFNKTFHTLTQVYCQWQKDAAAGGSANYGPVQYGAGGGQGEIIPGISKGFAIVNYFQILTSDKSYISIRTEYMDDSDGWRTGIKTSYSSHTIGFIYCFSSILLIRPEIRYDRTWGGNTLKAYDFGTKKDQFTFAADLILRF